MAKEIIELTKAEMQLPDFHFAEVEGLYLHDLNIPDELYQSLLEKERKILIEDLEKVLQHGIDNYKIFGGKNISHKNTFFVWHALLLLKDLEANESLPAVLNFLKQDEELVTFYLGELIDDFGLEIFYTLGNQHLRQLVDFAKTMTDDYLFRTEIILTLKQIALHQPHRKLEIESYLRELLLYATTISTLEDGFIDDVTDTLLEAIGELGLTRLFPQVESLIKEDKLPITYGIDWEDFEHNYILEKFNSETVYREFRTTKEIYTEYLQAQEDNDDLSDDFEDYMDDLDIDDADEDWEEEYDESDSEEEDKDKSYLDYVELHTPFVKKEPDVGRNDPCPCGSGKKYKKCHGKS